MQGQCACIPLPLMSLSDVGQPIQKRRTCVRAGRAGGLGALAEPAALWGRRLRGGCLCILFCGDARDNSAAVHDHLPIQHDHRHLCTIIDTPPLVCFTIKLTTGTWEIWRQGSIDATLSWTLASGGLSPWSCHPETQACVSTCCMTESRAAVWVLKTDIMLAAGLLRRLTFLYFSDHLSSAFISGPTSTQR